MPLQWTTSVIVQDTMRAAHGSGKGTLHPGTARQLLDDWMDLRQHRGALAETMAACYLQLQGVVILQRNAVCAGVEVDLVAREGGRLLVVEVKLRRRDHGFEPVPWVRPHQIRRLRRASAWLMGQCSWAESVRMDLIGVTWDASGQRMTLEHLQGIES